MLLWTVFIFRLYKKLRVKIVAGMYIDNKINQMKYN